ncbi:MFS transporter [Actinomadura scrupuli]|uniref:MFS transporter n=1 Tax=Actinomadura scrupuli TaxID=559629 RepID=UPI003D95AE73
MHFTAATLLRVSAEGTGTALVLLVQDRTGRAASSGFLLAAVLLPYVVSGPILGNALDRVGRTRLFATLLAGGYACAVALLLVVAGGVPLPLAVLAAAAVGCTEPIVVALTSLLPRIVSRPGLTRAYGLESASYNLAGIAGPGLVAGTAAWAGPQTAAVLVVGAAVLGTLTMSFLSVSPSVAEPPSPVEPPAPAAETGYDPPAAQYKDAQAARAGDAPAAGLNMITGGIVVLFRNPTLRALTVGSSVAFLGMGGVPIVAVLLAGHVGASATAGGQLLAAFALGALGGSLAAARWLSARRAEWVVVTGLIAFGITLAAAATATTLAWCTLCFALAGACDGPAFAATLTLRQREAPAARLGQVNTTGGSMKLGAAALGAALTGALADRAGAVGLLVTMAALQLAGAVSMAFLLSLRSRPRTGPEAGPTS